MLAISREEGESIVLNTPDGDVRVIVKSIRSSDQVKIAIDAPDAVEILREELVSSQEYPE